MSLIAWGYSDFAGGLQLVDQGGDLDTNKALDLADVRIQRAGEVRSRAGFVEFATEAELDPADPSAQPRALDVIPHTGGDFVLVQYGNVISILDMGGALIDELTLGTSDRATMARIGTPGQELVYISDGEVVTVTDGVTFSSLATAVTMEETPGLAMPIPKVFLVTPWDNRLIAAGFKETDEGPGGELSSVSTVYFSAPGDPLEWRDTWRNHLTPGDGEGIVAGCVWRDRVFIFKDSKFFVFYGTSDDGQGNPIFDYFTVDQGVGAVGPHAVCAAPEGVYVVDRKGVYLTTGEDVTKVSSDLDVMFENRLAPFFSGDLPDTAVLDDCSMASCNGRIYLALRGGAGAYALWVYDARYASWGYDLVDAGAITGASFGAEEQLIVARADEVRVDRQVEGTILDVDQDFQGFWRGSWLSFGTAGEKKIRQSRIWGSGQVALAYSADYESLGGGGQCSLGHPLELWEGDDATELWEGDETDETWGSGGQFGDGWVRYAIWGEVHSFEIRGTEGPWSVQRIEHHLVGPRPPGMDSRSEP